MWKLYSLSLCWRKLKVDLHGENTPSYLPNATSCTVSSDLPWLVRFGFPIVACGPISLTFLVNLISKCCLSWKELCSSGYLIFLRKRPCHHCLDLGVRTWHRWFKVNHQLSLIRNVWIILLCCLRRRSSQIVFCSLLWMCKSNN